MLYTDRIHLVADSLEELHGFAEKIRLKRCYFEGFRKGRAHYDLLAKSVKPVYINGTPALDICLSLGVKIVRPREILRISKLISQKNPFQQSLQLISFANQMFKGSKPMVGEELDILREAIKKSAKSKPTLPNRN